MMTSQSSLTAAKSPAFFVQDGWMHLLQRLEQCTLVAKLSVWLTALLDEDVSPRAVVHLLHTQLSVLAFFLPVGEHPMVYFLLGVWLVLAVQGLCRHIGWRDA